MNKQKLLVLFAVAVLFLFWINMESVVTEPQPQGLQEQPQEPKPQPEPEPEKPDGVLPNTPGYTQQEAKDTITEGEHEEWVRWFAHPDREGRMSGKKGNFDSAEAIKMAFMTYGLTEVQFQRFDIQRMNNGPNNEQGKTYTYNIIGRIKGKTDKKIVIGAHMDHLGYGPYGSRSNTSNQIHPGADDNASGTAVIMQIAEAFAKMDQPNHTLEFIAFSGEEMGLIGSRYYVQQLTRDERNNISLMVNFDMVGYLKDQRSLTVSGIAGIGDLVNICRVLDDKYPFTVRAAGSGGGGSDHQPFAAAGIPFAFFHTGNNRYYHTIEDTPDKIDYTGLNLIAQFAFEMISEFDKNGYTRRIQFSYPPMSATHDHGIEPFESGWSKGTRTEIERFKSFKPF